MLTPLLWCARILVRKYWMFLFRGGSQQRQYPFEFRYAIAPGLPKPTKGRNEAKLKRQLARVVPWKEFLHHAFVNFQTGCDGIFFEVRIIEDRSSSPDDTKIRSGGPRRFQPGIRDKLL